MKQNITPHITDYIYALTHTFDGQKIIFYVGRTIHPEQRLKEHRYGARSFAAGDEDKYQYASILDENAITWDMEILMECGPDTELFEDYFVNLYHSQYLTNMRGGDTEAFAGRTFKGPREFLAARTLYDEQQALAAAERGRIAAMESRRKSEADVERTLFDWEKVETRFSSPAFLALRARNATGAAKGRSKWK